MSDHAREHDLTISGPVTPDQGSQKDYVAVSVYRNGQFVVSIETNCLSGRDISPADEKAIEWAADSLLGFIGASRSSLVGSGEKSAEWARDNCHMLARREIRRLQRELVDQGGTGMTPVTVAIGTWQHIIRMCEKAGYQPTGVLRESSSVGATPTDAVAALTAIVREADQLFERVGGSSRHWVRDCFLPLLERAGWTMTRNVEPLVCRRCGEPLRQDSQGDWMDAETHLSCATDGRKHEAIANPAASVGAGIGWQPIETAPKDGRFVLLLDRANIPGDGVIMGRYDADAGAWYDGCGMERYEQDESLKPTRWRPIPAPPDTESDDPVWCAGCGARWKTPEGFIIFGVVHLCGDCWRKAQHIFNPRSASVGSGEDVIARIVQEMRQWCADNSGHYHEDDIEDVVARWADALASSGAPPTTVSEIIFYQGVHNCAGAPQRTDMQQDRQKRLEAFRQSYFNTPPNDISQLAADAMIVVIDLEAERRELLAPQRTAEGWRPIATAPKDKSWYLGWNADCGCFIWRDGPGLITGEDPAPTHWQPLPPPPSALNVGAQEDPEK